MVYSIYIFFIIKGGISLIKIAIMGHGTVGSGVVEVLSTNHASITAKAAEEIQIKYILDLKEFPGLPYSDLFIKDFDLIVNDPEIDVVVEVMGGLNPAYDFVKRCLLAGKSVVTSNKELVAAKGGELLQIAREKNLNFLFEASVGGGIPVIRPIAQCMAANEITEVLGILNGTTNFILTKMIKEGMSFDEALALAKANGYAEADPSADIEGKDACRKICILASLAYGRHVFPAQVSTEGISRVSSVDVAYANAWGGVIKLIGRAKKIDPNSLECVVAPMLIRNENPLSTVDDVFNAVVVRGNATGDVMFYGKGAGKLPTASAVVADVIDCVKHMKARKYLFWEDGCPDYVIDQDQSSTALYVRCKTADCEKAEVLIRDTFGDVEFLFCREAAAHEITFVTPQGQEGELRKKIKSLSTMLEVINIMRICD